MKRYKLTIQPEYCNDWSIADAIREILQNCLDAPSTFEWDAGLDYMTLTSKNTQLPQSTLLLGNTSKRGDKDSVGGKGEGYKLAMMILVREGVGIEIRNGNKLWVPIIEWDQDFEANMLVVNETELTNNTDLTFFIKDIDQDTIDTVIHNCLYLQDQNSFGNYATAGCGSRIFFDVEGLLYVGGLFVCSTNLQYSYDLHPSKIKLTRDRRECSGWDLQGVTASLLKEVAEPKRIVEAAQKDVADVHHMQYSWSVSSIPSEVADEAYNVFKEAYGDDAVVAESYSEMVSLQEQGFVKPVVVNDSFARLIRSSSDYETTFSEQEDALEVEEEKSPLELLEEWKAEWGYNNSPSGLESFEKILDIFRERELEYKYAAKNKTVKGEFDDIQF